MNSVCLVNFPGLTPPNAIGLASFRAKMETDFSLFDSILGVRLNFGQTCPPFVVDTCCRMLVSDASMWVLPLFVRESDQIKLDRDSQRPYESIPDGWFLGCALRS